jgi:hypothetical protein
MSNPQPIQMPSLRHHTAPKFSLEQPMELKRFFEELTNLFRPAGITTDAEKKSQTVRYLDVDSADMWKSLEGFTNQNVTYDNWKKQVIALYPGADEEKRWSMADMDKLVGERSRLGIYNVTNFGAYYCAYYMIMSFLIQKQRLSKAEQSRVFIRGLSQELWQRINM